MSVTALLPGAQFADRYEVVRCIDLGGMGAVYEVLHLETRRRRALKVMLPSVVENEDLRRRFKLEATVAAEVVSDHIVETFDAGIDEESGAPFLVMELLRGVELGSLLRTLGPLPEDDVVYILRQVARGLDKTHAAGIVHRDLKPENIYLTKRDDGQIWVKILDFGVAKVITDVTHPAKTKVMGTPLYMAPEQLTGDGRVAAPADLYALAHVAFRLLVGQAFWKTEADSAESIFDFLLKVIQGNPQPATARARDWGTPLAPAFDAWFERATRKKPEERFADAEEQIDALADLLGCSPDGSATEVLSARFADALAEGPTLTSPELEQLATVPSDIDELRSSSGDSTPMTAGDGEGQGLGGTRTHHPLTRDPPPSAVSKSSGSTWLGLSAVIIVMAVLGVGRVLSDRRGSANEGQPAASTPFLGSSADEPSPPVSTPAAPSASAPDPPDPPAETTAQTVSSSPSARPWRPPRPSPRVVPPSWRTPTPPPKTPPPPKVPREKVPEAAPKPAPEPLDPLKVR